jgi:hypothetical protein
VRLKGLVRARSNLGPNHLDLVATIASINIVGSLRYLPYEDINWQQLILQTHTSIVFKSRRADWEAWARLLHL